MQATTISKATTNFLEKLDAADVVVINDEKFIISKKADWAGGPIQRKIEDYETVLETDYTIFSWWEVCNELEQLNEQQWKIGEDVVAFLSFAPV